MRTFGSLRLEGDPKPTSLLGLGCVVLAGILMAGLLAFAIWMAAREMPS